MIKKWHRLLSLLLCAVMLSVQLPVQALAYMMGTPGGSLSVSTQDGLVVTDESWETRFPYGTFAFGDSQLVIAEGGSAGTIEVYRLGGTKGRATVYLTYEPVLAEVAEGEGTTAYAAGTNDIRILVEDTQPAAQYQPLGKPDDPAAPSQQVDLVRSVPAQGEDGAAPLETDLQLEAPAQASAWQWQVLSDGVWQNIEDGSTSSIVLAQADLDTYDFRCIYTVDGVRYCTRTASGADYVAPEQEVLEPMPEAIELNAPATYSPLDTSGGEEFSGYFFALTFADGEWVKELHVEALDDDLIESDEFGVFTLVDCDGGELYSTAATLSMQVQDNEDAGKAQVGFEVESIKADKADGKLTINVVRTGDMTQMFSVGYATQDGSAAAGTDYVACEGRLAFQGADFSVMPIEIELIDDHKVDEEPRSFTVTLSEILGGGEEQKVELALATLTVELTNSGTGEVTTTASMLYLTDAVDALGQMQIAQPVVGAEETISAQQQKNESMVASVEQEKSSASFAWGGSENPVSGNELLANITFTSTESKTGYWQPVTKLRSYSGTEQDYKDALANMKADNSQYGQNSKIDTITNGMVIDVTNSRSNDISESDYNTSDGRLRYSYKYGGYTQMGLSERFGQYYSDVAFVYNQFSRQLSWSYARFVNSKGENVSTSNEYTNAHFFSSHLSDYYYDNAGSLTKYIKDGKSAFDFAALRSVAWNKDTLSDGLWTEGEKVYGYAKATLPLSKDITGFRVGAYDGNVVAAWHGHSEMSDMFADRRVFTGGLQVQLHLPDGTNLTQADKKEVWDSLKVEIADGAGGTNKSGHLYVGSTIKITLNDNNYRIVDGTNMAAVEWADNSYTNLTASATSLSFQMYNSDLTSTMLNGTTVVHLALTRPQTIKMSVAGNIGVGGLSSEKAACDLFAASGTPTVSGTWYKRTTDKLSPFVSTSLIYNKSSLAGKDGQNEYELVKTENLRTINFNLDPLDVILFNGNKYAGNETITLSKEEQKTPTLLFYYYNKDYLEVQSLMHASLSAAELYLDVNQNGKIDPQAGDLYVGELDPEKTYPEDSFAPLQDDNGNYIQYLSRIKYTMNPRSMNPVAGKENAKAQVVPGLVGSAVTETAKADLTDEQLAYRYLTGCQNDSGTYTTDNHPMYGAQASALSYIDVALGGDYSQPEIGTGENYTWNPNYKGSLIYPYDSPQPILVTGLKQGDLIQLAPTVSVGENLQLIYNSSAEKDNVNGYLGALVACSALTIGVQEQACTMTQLIAQQNRKQIAPESTLTISKGVMPSARSLQNMSQSNSSPLAADVDTSSYGDNSYPEIGFDMGTELPSLNLALGDYVTVITDGYDVGFAIGLPIVGRDMNQKGTGAWDKGGTDTFNSLNKGTFSDFKKFVQSGKGQGIKEGTKEGGGGIKSKNFNVQFTVGAGFIWTYNPLDNGYYFSEFSITAKAALSFRIQYRFSAAPVLYIYALFAFELEVSTHVTVERVVVDGKYTLKSADTDIQLLTALSGGTAKPEQFVFSTTSAMVSLNMKGKLLVEVFDDAACTVQNKDFTPSYVRSADVTDESQIRLSDADLSSTLPTRYVRLTALADTTIDVIKDIKGVTSEVAWDALVISPSVYVELGGGVGVDVLKAEIFFKISVGVTMVLGKGVTTSGGDAFQVDNFSFGVGIGIRLVCFLFNVDIDAFFYQLNMTRDANNNAEWTSGWTALNGIFSGESHIKNASPSGQSTMQTTGAISLPQSSYDTQHSYTPQENATKQTTDGGALYAYNPSDPSVPFQYSGYGAGGDAFKLVDGLSAGYTYRVVTVGDSNYLLYMRSRNASSLDASMLILSKIQEESSSGAYGLVHPDPAGEGNYLILDNDATGDLEFSATEKNGKLYVTWTSYATQTTQEEVNAADPATLQVSAAENVTVKSCVVDIANGFTVSAAEVVSGMHKVVDVPKDDTAEPPVEEESHQEATPTTAFLPQVLKGDVAAYGGADKNQAAIDAAKKDYAAFLLAQYPDDAADPVITQSNTANRTGLATYQNMMYDVYGINSVLNLAAKNADGRWVQQPVSLTGMLENARLFEVGDKICVIYSTAECYYVTAAGTVTSDVGQATDRVTKRTMYLAPITIDAAKTDPAEVIKFGSPVRLQTLADYQMDNTKDGIVGGASYENPLFSNLQTLYGKLTGDTPETFVMYELNGNCWYISQASLNSLLSNPVGNWSLTPFFTVEGSSANAQTSASGKTEVTIGADGEGNISAVYAASVVGTGNNALYLTKYDAASGDWGQGSMLAMRHMDVYEDNLAGKLEGQDLTDAYYAADRQPDGSVKELALSNIQIALGKTPDAQQSGTLLVLTEGSLATLVEQTLYGTQMMVRQGASENGVYALSFGVGSQGIGQTSLSTNTDNFTKDTVLQLDLSFVNTGDVSLRGAPDTANVKNAITVSLMADTQEIASWKIETNIKAGQQVQLSGISAALANDLQKGQSITLLVSEAADYITASGGTPFSVSVPLLVRDDRPELAISNITLGSESVTPAGDTLLHMDFEVKNHAGKGTAAVVEINYLDETGAYKPLQLYGLKAGAQSTTGTQLVCETLNAGKSTQVSGTVILPRSAYNNPDDGRAEIQVKVSGGTEYCTVNNSITQSIHPATLFKAPGGFVTSLGNTMRLATQVQHTIASETGSVTAREILQPDQTERNLGILYYDEQTDAVVLTARQIGSGYIRLEDTSTGSYVDVAYTIAGTNYGIDIYNDNQLFTFKDASGAVYDKDANNDWRFTDGWPSWGLGTPDPENPIKAPSRGTLSTSNKKGTSFSFESRCDMMDLSFDGRIQVTDLKEGETKPRVIYTSATGAKDDYTRTPLRLDFGENTAQNVHTITITSLDDKVQYDCLIEYFSSGAPLTPADDQAAPLIFFNRSFPDTASMETSGGEEIDLNVAITDSSGLSSLVVRIDGVQLTGLSTTSNADKTMVTFPLKVDKNQNITIIARDKAGNPTIRTVLAQWYEDIISINAGPATAPLVTAEILDKNLAAPTTYLKAGEAQVHYQSTESGAQNASITKVELLYAKDNVVKTIKTVTDPAELSSGSMELTMGNGIYLVRVTEEVELHQKTYTTWAQQVLMMEWFESGLISGLLGEIPNASPRMLSYTVQKTEGANIKSIKINDVEQTFTPSRWVTGTMHLLYGGKYVLTAHDQSAQTFTDTYEATNVSIDAANAVKMSAEKGIGTLSIDKSKITGGNYLVSELAQNGVYVGSYESALVEQDDAFAGTLGTQEAERYFNALTWKALDETKQATVYENLNAGAYVLYVRDATDKTNTEVIAQIGGLSVAEWSEVVPDNTDPEYIYWIGVALKLDKMTGGVLRVHAGNYDKMPVIVMETLAEHSNVTLIIHWNGGSTITIRGWQALPTEGARAYWPLSLLAELFNADTQAEIPLSEDDVTIDAPKEEKVKEITPSDGGYEENPFPNQQPDQNEKAGSFVWLWMLLLAGAGVMIIIIVRRRNKNQPE